MARRTEASSTAIRRTWTPSLSNLGTTVPVERIQLVLSATAERLPEGPDRGDLQAELQISSGDRFDNCQSVGGSLVQSIQVDCSVIVSAGMRVAVFLKGTNFPSPSAEFAIA